MEGIELEGYPHLDICSIIEGDTKIQISVRLSLDYIREDFSKGEIIYPYLMGKLVTLYYTSGNTPIKKLLSLTDAYPYSHKELTGKPGELKLQFDTEKGEELHINYAAYQSDTNPDYIYYTMVFDKLS